MRDKSLSVRAGSVRRSRAREVFVTPPGPGSARASVSGSNSTAVILDHDKSRKDTSDAPAGIAEQSGGNAYVGRVLISFSSFLSIPSSLR